MKDSLPESTPLRNDIMLMIPGPVSVDRTVLEEMASPLTPHYGDDWGRFYGETIELLRLVHGTSGRVFLLIGSGSAGLDAVIGTTASTVDRLLVLSNGFFGERIEEIARTHTVHVSVLNFPWGTPVSVDAVDEALADGPASAVIVAHCETSTGVLNPVEQIAAVCRRHNAMMVVDAISSLGIEPLWMDDWGIDVCVSASQKGLEAPPGLATVAVGEKAWQHLANATPHGWYLNLIVWDRFEKEWKDWHPHPVTHAVNNVRAFNAALRQVLDEGMERRWTRHRATAERIRFGLKSLAITPVVADEFCSHGVTAAVPETESGRLAERLRTEHGILIAGGLGAWKGRIIRIGHMGPGATSPAADRLLSAAREAVHALSDML